MNISKIPAELLEYIDTLPTDKGGCIALRDAFVKALPIVKDLKIGMPNPFLPMDPLSDTMKVKLEGTFGDIVVCVPLTHPEHSDIQCGKEAYRISKFLDKEGMRHSLPPGFHTVKLGKIGKATLSPSDFIAEDLSMNTSLHTPLHVGVIDEIKKELESRGDYELDIPKLVDKLFVLGVIKAKEGKDYDF